MLKLNVSVLLCLIILLTSGSANNELAECDQRNADLLVSMQKCDDANAQLEKELAIEKAKKNSFIIRLPFTDIGITTEETKGAIYSALACEVHPLFLLGLLF